MNTKGNFKAEAKGAIRRVMSMVALSVFADEGDPQPPTNTGATSTQQINYEELIKQVRQEEKDKLYGQINSLKERNKVLVESNNETLIKCAELKTQLEAEIAKQNNGEKTEEVLKLEKRISELEDENKTLKESTPDEATLRQQIEAEFTVKNHLSTVKEKNKDKVLDVFMNEITGNTVEEIDNSLAKAIEKSDSVRKQVIGDKPDGNKKPQTGKDPKDPKQSKPATPPVANPNGGSTMPKGFDPEYVRGLQPGTPEYEEFRKSLGLH